MSGLFWGMAYWVGATLYMLWQARELGQRVSDRQPGYLAVWPWVRLGVLSVVWPLTLLLGAIVHRLPRRRP